MIALTFALYFLVAVTSRTECSVGPAGETVCVERELTLTEKNTIPDVFADPSDSSELIYRSYTARELWDQYNVFYNTHIDEMFPLDVMGSTATINSDYLSVLKSDDSPSKQNHFDVSYGTAQREKLDIFVAKEENAPIHVFIHGGYWAMELHKDSHYAFSRHFIENGITFMSVDYELVPKVTMSEQVRQARTALAWIWKNAETYGANRDRIHLSGGSAGGHLAAEVFATSWPDFEEGLPTDLIKSCSLLTGIFDMVPVGHLPWKTPIHLTPQAAREISPVFKKPPTNAPVMAAVGQNESREWVRQNQELVQEWSTYGSPAQLLLMEDGNHLTVYWSYVSGHIQEPIKKMLEFIATDHLRDIKPLDGKVDLSMHL